jgi:NADH-quinone oxidoreductase subunit N
MDIFQLWISVKSSLPELTVLVIGLVVLTLDFALPKMKKIVLAWISIGGFVLAIALTFPLVGENLSLYSGGFAVDSFAIVFKLIFLVSSILVVLVSVSFLDREKLDSGEYYSLIVFTTAGMMTLAAGTDLAVIYVALELSSISSYILAGFSVYEKRSNESAIKYFILGALSSAILLYGISLVYGLTGQINIHAIARQLASTSTTDPLLIGGVIFIMVGFGFKIAAVPFHMYAPDTYEGAPTPVAAFISAGPKAAAAAAMLRIFIVAADVMKVQWVFLFMILAAITMTLGNFMALRQDSVKRMLAYSGIANSGYALIGFVAAGRMPEIGVSSVILYFVLYIIANIGAFAVIIPISGKGGKGESYEDIKGLGRISPMVALTMSIFLLSLAGIPPTGGFFAKFWIFAAAVKAKYYWLALLGVINAVVAVYYYLRVTVYMYFYPPPDENYSADAWNNCNHFKWGLVIMALITVYMGVAPGVFFDYAIRSVSSLM